jgi:hypothetical protein
MDKLERLNTFLKSCHDRMNSAPKIIDEVNEILSEQFDNIERAKDAQAELIKAYDEKINGLELDIANLKRQIRP